ERLLHTAWPLWDNEAERCSRALSRAWVEASQAYPQAPDEKLVKRYKKWAAGLTSLREKVDREFEQVKQECGSVIVAAETNPAEDALKAAEQDITAKLNVWRVQAVKRAEELVAEGVKDLWAYARQLAAKPAQAQ
ncbi:MAG: hypothetical protein EBZ48_15620, partial [Proteobacteria bacterium]|nr:hypothetical protein [Pseudomonadota bacterium]